MVGEFKKVMEEEVEVSIPPILFFSPLKDRFSRVSCIVDLLLKTNSNLDLSQTERCDQRPAYTPYAWH